MKNKFFLLTRIRIVPESFFKNALQQRKRKVIFIKLIDSSKIYFKIYFFKNSVSLVIPFIYKNDYPKNLNNKHIFFILLAYYNNNKNKPVDITINILHIFWEDSIPDIYLVRENDIVKPSILLINTLKDINSRLEVIYKNSEGLEFNNKPSIENIYRLLNLSDNDLKLGKMKSNIKIDKSFIERIQPDFALFPIHEAIFNEVYKYLYVHISFDINYFNPIKEKKYPLKNWNKEDILSYNHFLDTLKL